MKKKHILIGWSEDTGEFECDMGDGVLPSDLAMFALHLQEMALGKANYSPKEADVEIVLRFFEEHPIQSYKTTKISEYLKMDMEKLKRALKQLEIDCLVKQSRSGYYRLDTTRCSNEYGRE